MSVNETIINKMTNIFTAHGAKNICENRTINIEKKEELFRSETQYLALIGATM